MVPASLGFATQAGNLVLLRRQPDRLEVRFTARWAAFMPLRHHTTEQPPADADQAELPQEHSTTAPAQPWVAPREVGLMACLGPIQQLPRRSGEEMVPDHLVGPVDRLPVAAHGHG